MLKKSITYKDFNGVERTEDFYFNLSKSELTQMEIAVNGGMKEKLDRIIAAQNGREILEVFRDIILGSYGVRSDDGRFFHKSDEISKAFEQSAAYDVFFMEMITDPDAASNFINGLMPQDLVQEVQRTQAQQNVGVPQDYKPAHQSNITFNPNPDYQGQIQDTDTSQGSQIGQQPWERPNPGQNPYNPQ